MARKDQMNLAKNVFLLMETKGLISKCKDRGTELLVNEN